MRFSEQSLKEVMASVLKIELEEINEDSSPDNIEAWDSLKHLLLVIALEDKFGVSFTEEESVEILNYALIKLVLSEHGVELF
jgi:acyl carrier protein